MSATDELRRMLDERGVKYSHEDVTEGTLFVVTRDVRIYYILAREKGFEVWSDWLTPEQAVEATLGRGECRMNESDLPVFNGHDDGYFSICSECGFVNYMRRAWMPTKFCPNCGRKVVRQ